MGEGETGVLIEPTDSRLIGASLLYLIPFNSDSIGLYSYVHLVNCNSHTSPLIDRL